MEFSQHAAERQVERGISSFTIDCLLEFGEVEFHRGREVYTFSRKSEKRLKTYMGGISLEATKVLKNVYVVATGEKVITVAWKTRHLKRGRR